MAGPSDTQILQTIREALQIRADYIAGAEQAPNLIAELERDARSYLAIMQDVADSLARWRRLWTTNGMDAQIDAPGAESSGEFSILRWMELRAAFREFEAFMTTPIIVELTPGVMAPIVPIATISRRGNPPEAAPQAQPAPQEE